MDPLSGEQKPSAPSSSTSEPTVTTASKGRGPVLPVVLFLLIAGMAGWFALSNSDIDPTTEEQQPLGVLRQDDTIDPDIAFSDDRLDAVMAAQVVPRPLLLAELYAAHPAAEGLRLLYDEVGGIDGLKVATAQGSFDMVRFDPLNRDRLLASNRLSYGEARNQRVNELWQLMATGPDEALVDQTLWAPDTVHDFVHYNVDGTATMWVHGGGEGFAPRVAVSLDNDLNPVSASETGITDPLYASRFTAANGKVFALTGTGEYYSNDSGYVNLVVDDGSSQIGLTSAEDLEWIDNPTPEILVAYPTSSAGVTRVWSTETLAELPSHPLAGRRYTRSAVSGDGQIAIGATFGGNLQVLDLQAGTVTTTFGSVDVTGIDQPLTLTDDGQVVITVERGGSVTMWWVGDNEPLAQFRGSAGQPRWVSEEHAATAATAVAADGTRIALRIAARAGVETRWVIIDTDPASWVRRACGRAGREITRTEAGSLGLPDGPRVCQG